MCLLTRTYNLSYVSVYSDQEDCGWDLKTNLRAGFILNANRKLYDSLSFSDTSIVVGSVPFMYLLCHGDDLLCSFL